MRWKNVTTKYRSAQNVVWCLIVFATVAREIDEKRDEHNRIVEQNI